MGGESPAPWPWSWGGGPSSKCSGALAVRCLYVDRVMGLARSCRCTKVLPALGEFARPMTAKARSGGTVTRWPHRQDFRIINAVLRCHCVSIGLTATRGVSLRSILDAGFSHRYQRESLPRQPCLFAVGLGVESEARPAVEAKCPTSREHGARDSTTGFGAHWREREHSCVGTPRCRNRPFLPRRREFQSPRVRDTEVSEQAGFGLGMPRRPGD